MRHEDPTTSRIVRRFKLLVIVGCAGTLAVLGGEAWREHAGGEWRHWQAEYAAVLAPEYRANFEVGIKQAFLPALGRVDRCQTCHVGIDDPAMAEAEQPLRSHPGTLLEKHPVEDFGCTICHQGQGRATSREAAHGRVPHWTEPLLEGDLVYTSCGRCHAENGLFGTEAEFFGTRAVAGEIGADELDRSVPGADLVARGKALMRRSGCLGCHSYRGRGGVLGPDLTHEGDKEVHDFDYSHVPPGVEHTPYQWFVQHFLDPGAVSPGSIMPGMGLAEEDARALAAYMLSLKAPDVPPRYRPAPAGGRGEPADGRTLYELFCIACHGRDLDSGQVPAIRTPSLSNPDFLDVAGDDYLYAIIRNGRSGTNMPAWGAEQGGGLSDGEIGRLVAYLRSRQAAGPELDLVSARRGNPDFGRALYRGNCATCHGQEGEGGIGTRLNSADTLALLADAMLAQTIAEGRPGTGMPAWKDLDTRDLSDLLAFLRSWQGGGAEPKAVEAYVASGRARPRVGRSLYRAHCQACHGRKGEGLIGPSLDKPEFLGRVPDSYLVHAIRDGRPGTAMPAWRQFQAEDIGDLVAWLRSLAKVSYTPPSPVLEQGDPEVGGILYRRACESCHGPDAVGGVGPQLRNPVFLDHASDGFLRETISYGRPGTAMRGFLKGGDQAGGREPGAAGIAEFSRRQIADIVAWLRSLRHAPAPTVQAPPVLGNRLRGRVIYEKTAACAGCHGFQGEGGVGPALGNPVFQKVAGEGFIIGTMVLGRQGTEMRDFRGNGITRLSAEQLMDVAAYVRSLGELGGGGSQRWRPYSATEDQMAMGGELFRQNCASCHGESGKDGFAPALNNPEFLAAASDGFLVATIARGRKGTPMRPFGPGTSGLAQLSFEEIRDIVAYLRSLAPKSGGAGAPGTAATPTLHPE